MKELFAKLGLEIDEAAFSKGEMAIEGLAEGFIAFGTAVLGAVAIGAAALAKSTADAASAANRLAQSTGTDLKTIQELGFAGEASGVSMETLAHSLQHLARTGVKDVRAGVLDLAEKFHGMPDSASARADKVRIAMEKFGHAGAQLVPFLNKGKGAISELMEEAEELGLVFSKEDVEASKEFNHEVHILEGAFRGLGYTVGRLVLPFFTWLVKGINSLIIAFRKNTTIVRDITLGLKTLAFVMGGALLTAITLNLGAIISTVGWYAALSVAAVSAGISAALAWAAATAPVVVLAAAFAAMLLVLEDVYVYLKGGDSLIGEMLPKWDTFYASFSQIHGSDPWWLTALKLASQLLENAIGPLRLLIGVGSMFITPDVAKNAAQPTAAFGGGVSPAASAQAKQGLPSDAAISMNKWRNELLDSGQTIGYGKNESMSRFTGHAPAQITNHITNNITQQPGMSAQDVVNKIKDQIGAHIDTVIRQAATGAQ